MRPRRPGAVKQLLMLIDDFRCQRCHLNLSKFPELIQLHHMIDREILWKARRDGLHRHFQEMRRNIEYQQILCPACHATVHECRERDYFFPNYNLNTSGNNVKLALESQMRMKVRVRGR